MFDRRFDVNYPSREEWKNNEVIVHSSQGPIQQIRANLQKTMIKIQSRPFFKPSYNFSGGEGKHTKFFRTRS